MGETLIIFLVSMKVMRFSKSEQLRLVMSMSLDFSCVFKSFLFDCLVDLFFSDVEERKKMLNIIYMRCEYIYITQTNTVL